MTIPDLPGNDAPEIIAIIPGDIIIGTSSPRITGTISFPRGTEDPYTVWAISDKPATRGQLLWIQNYPAPQDDITLAIVGVDPVNRVLMLLHSEIMEIVGYSIDDGRYLWGPTVTPERRDLDYFQQGRNIIAYGNWYVSGYGGEIYAYSTKNGSLLWRYKSFGPTQEGPWGYHPIQLNMAADGKIFAFNNEHSPQSPYYKHYSVYAVDAFTGEEVWKLGTWTGHAGGAGYPTGVLAEGVYTYYNYYDNSIYAIGKGPSATTVSIQNDVTTHGNKVLVKGSVIDISAGTKQHEQAMRFPNGVPAVADVSMSAWMEYVYTQKPRPTDVRGVEVIVEVLDPNNNYYEVGRTTSDANGMFKLMIEPVVPGEYTIAASFKGSESYWPSHAQTALFVEEATVGTEPTPAPQSVADKYFVPAIAGLFVAIILVGALTLLTLRRRP